MPIAKSQSLRVVFSTSRSLGFTLIEILVVVAIMAIVMTIAIPFIHSTVGKHKGINGAMKDVQEACSNARAFAILQQTTMELRIHPADGVFEVGASAEPTEHSRLESLDLHGQEWRMADRPAAKGGGGGSFSVKLPEGVVIEGLGVNGEDWSEDEVARIRFYKDGTSDEMSVVLYRPESNERRNVWLEVVTGLAEIETDPLKFKAR
jgi:prepilin-type N-terminal cleavage/methylation domain-containing protein